MKGDKRDMMSSVFGIGKNPSTYRLTRLGRSYVYFLLCLSVLGLNFITGTLSACNATVKKNMQITEQVYGIFNSLYYVGNVISTLIFLILIKDERRKSYMAFSLICSGLIISWYHATYNKYFILFSQLLVGFFSNSIFVYAIIWNDQFGVFRYKTVLLSVLFMFRSFGVALSLVFKYIYGAENYGNILFFNCFFLILIGIAISFVEEKYFRKKTVLAKAYNFNSKEQFVKRGYEEEKSEKRGSESKNTHTVFRNRKSVDEIIDTTDAKVISGLFHNPVWLFNLIGSTIMVAVTAAFNLWAAEFFGNFSKNSAKKDKNTQSNPEYDALMRALMMNLVGAIGAVLINLYITVGHGSYYSRTVAIFTFSFYIIIFIVGNIITHIEGEILITVFSGIYIMFSNAISPYFTGCNLSGSTPNKKPYGVAVVVLINGLVGGGLGMFVFSHLTEYAKDRKTALKNYMFLLLVGIAAAFLAMVFKGRLIEEEDEKAKRTTPKKKGIEKLYDIKNDYNLIDRDNEEEEIEELE